MKGLICIPEMALAIDEGIKTVTRRTGDKCPYVVGEPLYIKEPYIVSSLYDDLPPSQLPESVTINYLAVPTSQEDELGGRYRHARFMPEKLARNFVRVVSVTQEPISAITQIEAVREGFLPYIVEHILEPVASTVEPADCYYVFFEDNSRGPSGYLCRECAVKFAAAHPGGVMAPSLPDTDGFPGCDECGRVLSMCYTDYAIGSELEAWEEMLDGGRIPGAETIYVMWDMIGYNFDRYANKPEDFSGYVGRLALVGFRYLWRKLHPTSTEDNLVWRVEFEVVDN